MLTNDINYVINREMRRAIKAVLETKLSSEDNEEKRRQERMAKSVTDRGIVADSDDSKSETSEAEDDKPKDSKSKEEKSKEKQDDRTGGKGTADSPKVKDPKLDTLKSPTIGSMVDKLNALRGGKSLKDPDVKNSFAQYFEGLTTGERQTLLAFLTGIAQILAGTKKGSDAMEPSDIGVKTKKSDIEKKKAEKKNPKSSTGTEDNPIVVGENTQYDVVRALKAYRGSNSK